jgi:protein-S-isoprenylcysteine O-methyltransferase Ste14
VVRWNRVGDIGLCLLFSLIASIPVVRTYQAIIDGAPLLALYSALSGGALCIMAALLLVRKEALLKSSRRREQLVAVIGTFAIIPLGAFPRTWDADWLLELTSIGFILAYCWIVWALLTLRDSISVFPEARQLITRGPYGLVRHPLYAAYFVTYILVLIPHFSAVALALTIVGISAEVLRSRYEERVLRTAFPEYGAYAKRVRAFVPIKGRETSD